MLRVGIQYRAIPFIKEPVDTGTSGHTNFKSDWIYNMSHMHISGRNLSTDPLPSKVLLKIEMWYRNKSKTSWAKKVGQ